MSHSRKISCAVLIALGVLSMATRAAGEESIKKVAVPAGSLKVALKMLAEQSGAEFFYSTDQLEGLRTEGVNGEFTAEKAVQKLLEGTNLKLTRHESGALVITVPDKAAAADPVPDELEEIVVTALKSGAVALEKAPISVTALGGDMLRDGGFLDIADAIRFAPSVNEGISSGNRAQKVINIRGVGQNSNVSGGTTGYYVGEAAFFESVQAPTSRLYDIERVEILRGPQSTLYGNGAMGGVVRFIPNAPDLNEFEGSAFGGWSATEDGSDSYYGYGAINLPLVRDKLALRVAGGYEKIGGFGDTGLLGFPATAEDQDGGTITSVRSSLKYEATDRLSIDVLFQLSNTDFGASQLFNPFDRTRLTSGPDDNNDPKYRMLAGTVNYELGFASLTNVTTAIEQDTDAVTNVSFVGYADSSAISGSERSYIGNETRLVSANKGSLNWILGLFVTDDDVDTATDSSTEVFLPDSTGSTYIINSTGTIASERSTRAVFGEVSYKLFDGKLVPLVGLRYFEEDFKTDSLSLTELFLTSSTVGTTTTAFDPPMSLGAFPTAESSGKLKFDSVNPRFNLAYYPNDTSTYFINISNGFRGGTANTNALCAVTPGCPSSIPSDKLWNYEIGTKQSLMGGQIYVDLALYYMDWKRVREFVNLIVLNAQVAAGDAEIYGVDAAITATPRAIPGLTLSIVGNWNSSEFSSVTPAGVVAGAAVGDRISYVPDWTATVGVDYKKPINSRWVAHLNTSYNHIEEMRGGFGSLASLAVPLNPDGFGGKRDLVSARIGFKVDTLGVYFVGTNLLNEHDPVTIGSGIQTLDYPRTLGFEMTSDF
jgi:outer membrane receptor protein involved in Fe transport